MAPIFFVEKFENYLLTEKRYSTHTIVAYLNDINQFINFTECEKLEDFSELNHHNVRAWIVFLKDNEYENKSINRKIVALRSFFKFMIKSGSLNENPFSKIVGPKIKKRLPEFAKVNDLSDEKLSSLFKNDFDGIRDKLMFELFYQTGIRLSELIELRESNVSNSSIKVLGKRNKERIIPISENLAKEIYDYKSLKNKSLIKSDYLLTLFNGNKLYPKLVYRKINYYLSLATNMGKKSPHVLRHTFATHMLNNGAGLEVLKEILGHSNLAATQIYTHNSFAELTNIYSSAHPRGRKKN
jgi:integrase/recombinase XerC